MPNNPVRDHVSAMEGDGFYNRHSAMQAAASLPCFRFGKAACWTVPIDDRRLWFFPRPEFNGPDACGD